MQVQDNKPVDFEFISTLVCDADSESKSRLFEGLTDEQIDSELCGRSDIALRNQLLFDTTAVYAGEWTSQDSKNFNPFDVQTIKDLLDNVADSVQKDLPTISKNLSARLTTAEDDTPNSVAGFKKMFNKKIVDEGKFLAWFNKYVSVLVLGYDAQKPFGPTEWGQVKKLFEWMIKRHPNTSCRESLWTYAEYYVTSWYWSNKHQ